MGTPAARVLKLADVATPLHVPPRVLQACEPRAAVRARLEARLAIEMVDQAEGRESDVAAALRARFTMYGADEAFVCIEFYFDLVSPYAYLASTQLDRIAASTGVPVLWRPVILRELFQVNQVDHALTEDDTSWVRRDLGLWARRYGIRLEVPRYFSLESDTALATLCALPDADVAAAAKRLFEAYWAEGRDATDPAVVADLVGSSTDVARLRASTEAAIARKVFGVPTFFVGDDIYFGNDRLMFVEAAARRLS